MHFLAQIMRLARAYMHDAVIKWLGSRMIDTGCSHKEVLAGQHPILKKFCLRKSCESQQIFYLEHPCRSLLCMIILFDHLMSCVLELTIYSREPLPSSRSKARSGKSLKVCNNSSISITFTRTQEIFRRVVYARKLITLQVYRFEVCSRHKFVHPIGACLHVWNYSHAAHCFFFLQ